MRLLGTRYRWVLGCAVLGASWLFMVAPAWAVPPSAPDAGTWGTNGRVWSIVRLGNTVYIGGTFTQAVAPNGAQTPRSNLMAIDATTGALVTGFAPNPNGTVYALATDGSSLFAGGEFTTIAAHARSRFAAFDSSGALEPWTAEATSRVRSLAVAGSTLYMGGRFKKISGQKRVGLASLDLSTTTPTLTTWTPSVDQDVRGIAPLDNGIVVIGGVFDNVNGSPDQYLAAINTDGSTAPWSLHPTSQVWNVAPFGNDVLVAGGGTGTLDGVAYRATSTGAVVWLAGADGAVQTIAYDQTENLVIAGGHYLHVGGVSNPRLSALNPNNGALVSGWKPKPNSAKGVWALRVTANKIYVGGDFTLMNTSTYRRYAQFSIGP
jgi:hypothetical protein